MRSQSVRRMIPAFFAGLCCALMSPAAQPDEPRGTVRYFLEFLSSYVPDPGHDFEAEGSRRIVSHYKGAGGLQFGDSSYAAYRNIYDDEGNVIFDLASTMWVQSPVLHITDDGIERLQSIYWLVGEFEDAASLRRDLTGATAATGPDGDVETLAEVGISYLVGGGGDWYVDQFPDSLYRIRLCRGVFHK